MTPEKDTQSSLGKALQRIFQQEDLIRNIEAQDSTNSFFMSDIRREILFHLVGSPCDHLRGIAGHVSVKPPSANWHLSLLSEAGIVKSSTFRNRKVYWITGLIDNEHLEYLSLLRDKLDHDILRSLAIDGEMRENTVSREFEIKQQTAFKRLHYLENAGLIKGSGKGHGKLYAISQLLHELDSHYKDKAYDNQLAFMELLIKDGIRPKLRKRNGSLLYIDLNLPGGNERRKLQFNPIADVLAGMK